MECSLTGKAAEKPGRAVLYSMHALGREALPPRIVIGETAYTIAQFVKHDFFAATGFYRDSAGEQIVIKFGRTVPFLGIPMAWIGRWLVRREMSFYSRLADLPNVPKLLGRVGDIGFAHAFAPGQPLQKGMAVPDDFFAQLNALIDTFEARDMAIVDTNKPENIILGDDSRPHLIDFQISLDFSRFANIWPARRLLRAFIRTDRYHIAKHKSRLRPDLMTDADRAILRPSWHVRLHRRLTRPYFIVRRRLFAHLRATGRLMPEGSK